MIWNILLCLCIAATVVSVFMTIICNPAAPAGSWQNRLYVYIYEHDDYVLWKYVNAQGREKDIKFKEVHKWQDGEMPHATYYFTLPIPDYKSLKIRNKREWEQLVKWWDKGNEPELTLILWDSNGPEDAHTSIHAGGYCLASHFVWEESRELAETLLDKIYNEEIDYQS